MRLIIWTSRTTQMSSFAIPIAVGDNYHGYRLVGTIPEMFEGGVCSRKALRA